MGKQAGLFLGQLFGAAFEHDTGWGLRGAFAALFRIA